MLICKRLKKSTMAIKNVESMLCLIDYEPYAMLCAFENSRRQSMRLQ